MTIARIGRYETIRALDRRAESRVFLARVSGGTQTVVIEIAPLAEMGSEERRSAASRRFFDEARRLAAVEHPGLARLRDFGEDDGVLWWTSEFVEGTSLERHTGPEHALQPEVAIDCAVRAAEALAAIHAAGATHGAIRPTRLLRRGEIELEVVGARPGDPGGDPLARVGGAAARYLSPEQLRGRGIDGRSDQFSLAVVLFELLTGAAPFPGDSDSSVLYRIVHEEPLDPMTTGRGAPPEVEEAIRRALAKDPEKRFASAEAFAEALRRASVALHVDGALGAPPRPGATAAGVDRARTPVRSSPLPFVAGAFVVLALVVAGAWYLHGKLRPPGPPPPVWLEAEVRTEPAGLDVTADGRPLADPGRVRFPSTGPFPLLSASHECRLAEHRVEPADAGQVVVLVTDPETLDWTLDPGVSGAEVVLNHERLGATPLAIRLELCRENRLELRAAGYRTATVVLAAGATPLDARKNLYDLAIEEIPKGRLALPELDVRLVYYVDGRRLGAAERDIVLEEGEHVVRYKNEYHWIDGETRVAIAAGETVTPHLEGIALKTLVVQAFPANCKVYLRRGREAWRYLDETPAERRVATGRYEVKVVFVPTGEEQVREVELGPGASPPLRFAFGGRG